VLGWDGDVGFLAQLHLWLDAVIYHGDTEFTETTNFISRGLRGNKADIESFLVLRSEAIRVISVD